MSPSFLSVPVENPTKQKYCTFMGWSMVCEPVRRDNSRALARDLRPYGRTNHALCCLYHDIQCRPLHVTGYFLLNIGYLRTVVQCTFVRWGEDSSKLSARGRPADND